MSEGEFIAWSIVWFIGVLVLGVGWAVYLLATRAEELFSAALLAGWLLGALLVPTVVGLVAIRVHGMVFYR